MKHLDRSSSSTRRSFLASTAAAGAISIFGFAASSYGEAPDLPPATAEPPTTGEDNGIRPFRFQASKSQLVDLRRRILATRWPDRETVSDATQGVQLATMRKLATYWANNYDWRKVEARINALPQFVTTIDGLDIHFIHVRSKQANALPVIGRRPRVRLRCGADGEERENCGKKTTNLHRMLLIVQIILEGDRL